MHTPSAAKSENGEFIHYINRHINFIIIKRHYEIRRKLQKREHVTQEQTLNQNKRKTRADYF